MSQSSQSSLPARPSLEQLRKQAKELLKAYQAGDAGALARLRAHKPSITSPDGSRPAALADAQFTLAREHGFDSWPKLKRHIEVTTRPADYYAPTWGRDTWDFFVAIYDGREAQVRAMLRDDPSLVRAEYAYLQSLHYAVMANRPEMGRLLLGAGANPKAEGWMGRPLGDDSPLARARDREQPEMVALLEEAAAKPLIEMPARPETPLDALAQREREMSMLGTHGDERGVRAMLEKHPELAYAALYEAVHHGYTSIARLLLDHGADPTKPWRWACWFTPLMHSLRYDRPNWEMASMLMEHGVTANDKSGMGIYTLHILVSLGTPVAVEWLLDRGADINVRDHQFDSTPLAWAARMGRMEMVKLLLDRGAARTLPDDQPWNTPAAWARRRGHSDIERLVKSA